MPSTNLHRYATCLAFATFLLVCAGSLVTSTGSALAVPDWPLAFGQYFPKMEGGVLYEHGHRMIAGTIGILTFILAGWLWRAEQRPGVKYLGLLAVVAVCVQALLGGITVLYRLPVPISVAHACLGQVFFCLIVSIAVLTSSPAPVQCSSPKTKLQRLGLLTVGFIFFQLVAGATVRHTGKYLQPHFIGAALVAIHVPLLARRVLTSIPFSTGMAKTAAVLPVLLVFQIALGFISWKTGPVIITAAHVAIGALIFAGSVGITLQAFRVPV